MFFDPEDYLESDPAQAGSERERLWREAGQRAKLCEATTRLAARGGLAAAARSGRARRRGRSGQVPDAVAQRVVGPAFVKKCRQGLHPEGDRGPVAGQRRVVGEDDAVVLFAGCWRPVVQELEVEDVVGYEGAAIGGGAQELSL